MLSRSDLEQFVSAEWNDPASDDVLDSIGRGLRRSLPQPLRNMYRLSNGLFIEPGTVIYPAESLCERNDTFNVAQFLPGCLLIGDNSGSYFAFLSDADGAVVAAPTGAFLPDCLIKIADGLEQWLRSGCPFPQQRETTWSPSAVIEVYLEKMPAGGGGELLSLKRALMIDMPIAKMKVIAETQPAAITKGMTYIAARKRLAPIDRADEFLSIRLQSDPSVKLPMRLIQ